MPGVKLSPENRAWLDAFRAANGRPPLLLHIGNIANNAYHNAKLLNEVGLDCDVICYDYYHVMACPEWEEADFKGEISDPYFPDWWSVDLHGYRRPHWFCQGSLRLCIRYLLAVRLGHPRRARAYREMLSLQRWLRCRRSLESPGGFRRLRSLIVVPIALVTHHIVRIAYRGAVRVIAFSRQCPGVVRRMIVATARRVRKQLPFPVHTVLLAPLYRLYATIRERSWRLRAVGISNTLDLGEIRVRHQRFFPHVPAEEITSDIDTLANFARIWCPLLSHYDIVVGYSTDPQIPLACRHPHFAAFEHGTIRDIPFEPSWVGRLCALSYREAHVVLVTNSDNLAAAARLGIPEERIVCLPHPFDDRKLKRYRANYKGLSLPSNGKVTFFAPARHHWKQGYASWLKGNDLVVRAVRKLLDESWNFSVIFVDWGQETALTRSLIEELGCESAIEWLPEMQKSQLWARYLDSHCTIDQFTMPALGGIALEAMCLGRRVITRIDSPTLERFFGAAPPLLNAANPEEIAEAMRVVLRDPADEGKIGARCEEWMTRHHSSSRIVDLQLTAYREMLGPRRALEPHNHATVEHG